MLMLSRRLILVNWWHPCTNGLMTISQTFPQKGDRCWSAADKLGPKLTYLKILLDDVQINSYSESDGISKIFYWRGGNVFEIANVNINIQEKVNPREFPRFFRISDLNHCCTYPFFRQSYQWGMAGSAQVCRWSSHPSNSSTSAKLLSHHY